MSNNINIFKKVPRTLQSQFWKDFCDSFSDELNLLKSQVEIKKILLNIRELTDTDLLKEIFNLFGYIPNFSLYNNSNLDFILQELKTIVFKIKKKTTYPFYDYLFKSIPVDGFVYNLAFDQNTLYKVLDQGTTDTNLDVWDYSIPFTKLVPSYYFGGMISTLPFGLDQGQHLDASYYLDRNLTSSITQHIAVEIAPTTLIVYNTVTYLTAINYLNYIFEVAQYGKKCSEAAHIGVQINPITDTSRFCNNINGHLPYTIPDLLINFVVTQNYNGFIPKAHRFNKICAGMGTQTVPHYGDTLYPITALSNQYYIKNLSISESWDSLNYTKVMSFIPVNYVKGITIAIASNTGDPNTSTYSYSGTTPFSTNLVPKLFKISFIVAGNETIEEDTNGDGTLDSLYFTGTVDYTTGIYSFEFRKLYASGSLVISPGGVNSIVYDFALAHPKYSSFVLVYTYLSTAYQVTCNGSGVLVDGANHASGTLTENGLLTVNFDVTIDSVNVISSYSYYVYQIPDNGTNIQLEYKVIDSLPITEIGILDDNNNLVAYCTLPSSYLPNSNYHISFNGIIKR